MGYLADFCTMTPVLLKDTRSDKIIVLVLESSLPVSMDLAQ